MNKLSRKESFRKGLKYFDDILRKYNLRLEFDEDYEYGTAKLIGDSCIIDISADRYYPGLSIDVIDPMKSRQYFYGTIAQEREIYENEVPAPSQDDSHSDPNVLALKNTAYLMDKYCSDILFGDFSSVRCEYAEYEAKAHPAKKRPVSPNRENKTSKSTKLIIGLSFGALIIIAALRIGQKALWFDNQRTQTSHDVMATPPVLEEPNIESRYAKRRMSAQLFVDNVSLITQNEIDALKELPRAEREAQLGIYEAFLDANTPDLKPLTIEANGQSTQIHSIADFKLWTSETFDP